MKEYLNWMENFKAAGCKPMDDKLSMVFMNCVIHEKRSPIPDEIINSFLYQVIKKRAEYLQMETTDWACVFMSCLAKTPGTAIMYLYYLKGLNLDVTLDGITQAFPFGFPDDNDLEALWDMQKMKECDNMLDSQILQMFLLDREEYDKVVAG